MSQNEEESFDNSYGKHILPRLGLFSSKHRQEVMITIVMIAIVTHDEFGLR